MKHKHISAMETWARTLINVCARTWQAMVRAELEENFELSSRIQGFHTEQLAELERCMDTITTHRKERAHAKRKG